MLINNNQNVCLYMCVYIGILVYYPLAGHVGCTQYSSPEVVLRRIYGKGCDVWGAGIMLHVLLSGRLPFLGSGQRLQDIIGRGRVVVSWLQKNCPKGKCILCQTKLIRYIKNGCNNNTNHIRSQLESPEWKSISSNAKDLVLKMLAPNPHNRLTIEEVLDHPWMKDRDKIPKAHLADTVEELKRFNARRKLKGAVQSVAGGVLLDPLCTDTDSGKFFFWFLW